MDHDRRLSQLKAVLFVFVVGFVIFWIVLTFLGIRRFAYSADKSVTDTQDIKVDALAYDETREWKESIALIQDQLDVSESAASDVMDLIYRTFDNAFGYPCYALSSFERIDDRLHTVRIVSSESVGLLVTFNQNYDGVVNYSEVNLDGEHRSDPGKN